MLLLLAACGFDQYLEPVEEAGVPGRRDPPSLDALAPFRNEDQAEVTGLAAPGDSAITVTVKAGGSSESFSAELSEGRFLAAVTLPRGLEATITASNDNGESPGQTTLACDPWDRWEIDPVFNGDTCEDPIVVAEQLLDAEDLEVVLGNVLEEGDVDWYFVHTVDEPIVENSAGFENYNFTARLVEGAEAYELSVFRGACTSPECPDLGGFTEYGFFARDTDPDEAGDIPADPRACGEPPLNACEDYSESYWIKVQRTDGGLDCTHYRLELENGVW